MLRSSPRLACRHDGRRRTAQGPRAGPELIGGGRRPSIRGVSYRRRLDRNRPSQAVGFLLAAAAPPGLGLLHDRTGAWTEPLVVLPAVTAAALVIGLAAARDRSVG
jgi:CP family cyanate transporter-like MFS transporter